MNAAPSLHEVLARPDVWRGDRLASADMPAVASGFAVLDRELPGGGWPRGSVTEILSDAEGLGECSLLLPVLRQMRAENRWSLLAGPPHRLHAPAWAAAGADLARLAVVSPARTRDAQWAAEQALASGALGAVLCWSARADARQVRRLQVAAAGSGTLAFLFRPVTAQQESSAAPLRLLFSAGMRGTLIVRLLKRRGPPCPRLLTLELPRPAPWRAPPESAHASAVARTPSALPAARRQRTAALA